MLEHLKAWIIAHKALAAGGGIALVALLYLWLKGSPAPQATSGDQALAAYYGAEASSLQGAAAQAQSTDALAASTNQTNAALSVSTGQTDAAKAVALAQIDLQKTGLAAQLKALEEELNLTAYHDYLAETAGAGAGSTAPQKMIGLEVGDNAPLVWNGVQGAGSTLTNLLTGQVTYNAAGGPVEVQPGTFSPYGPAPHAPATILQFGDFHGLGNPSPPSFAPAPGDPPALILYPLPGTPLAAGAVA